MGGHWRHEHFVDAHWVDAHWAEAVVPPEPTPEPAPEREFTFTGRDERGWRRGGMPHVGNWPHRSR